MTQEKQKVLHEVNDDSFFGLNAQVMEVALPCGKIINIRERNGEDEEILSNIAFNNDGSAFSRYLSAICSSPQQTISQVDDWRASSKYYALFKSRMQSLGNELIWEHEFADGSIAFMEEDLSKYDFDFRTNEEFVEKDPHGIKPYPDLTLGEGAKAMYFEDVTSSGIHFKMRYLTGNLEKETLGLEAGNLSRNTRLTLRDFHIKRSDTWQPIGNFKMFSSRDMTEFRKSVEKNDPEFSLTIPIKSPKGNREDVCLFLLPDFFFQGG